MRKCVRLGSGISLYSSLLFVRDSKPLVGAENRWSRHMVLKAASKTSGSASGPDSPQPSLPLMFSISCKACAGLPVPQPPYLAPSLFWKRTKALWSSLHATVKIEHRCGAIYAQPKTLFYSHINSAESIRLMSNEERAYVTGLTKFSSLKSRTDNLGISKGLICRDHISCKSAQWDIVPLHNRRGTIYSRCVLHRFIYICTQYMLL